MSEEQSTISFDIQTQLTKMSLFLNVIGVYIKLNFITFATNFLGIILMFAIHTTVWLENGRILISTATYITTAFFIFGLGLYSFSHFIAAYNFKLVITSKYYIAVIVSLIWFCLPVLLYKLNVPYLFYYGDVLILVIGYVGLSILLGYCGETSQKFRRGFELLLTELIVSVMSLLYGMFLMTVYHKLSSDTHRLLWRSFVYPLYFELIVMMPVRLIITKRIQSKNEILRVLAVVHAQVHISTMGKFMMTTYNSKWILFGSVILINSGKLITRSTITVRDNFARKIFSKLNELRLGMKNNKSRSTPTEELKMKSKAQKTEVLGAAVDESMANIHLSKYDSECVVDVPNTLNSTESKLVVESVSANTSTNSSPNCSPIMTSPSKVLVRDFSSTNSVGGGVYYNSTPTLIVTSISNCSTSDKFFSHSQKMPDLRSMEFNRSISSFSAPRTSQTVSSLEAFHDDIDLNEDPTNFICSVLIFTEMFADNVAIVVSTFAIKLLENSKFAFTFPFPSHSVSWDDILLIMAIQLAVAVPFDILSIFINHQFFKLKMLNVWNEIMLKKFKFFGFLIFGVLSMGALGSIYIGLLIPRFVFCSSDDICTCWNKPHNMICT